MEEKDLFGNIIVRDSDNVYVNKSPKDLSKETTVEYVVEVILSDEKSQEAIYNELTQRGLKCRVLTL